MVTRAEKLLREFLNTPSVSLEQFKVGWLGTVLPMLQNSELRHSALPGLSQMPTVF